MTTLHVFTIINYRPNFWIVVSNCCNTVRVERRQLNFVFGIFIKRLFNLANFEDVLTATYGTGSLIGHNAASRYDFHHKKRSRCINRAIAGVMPNRESQKANRDPKLVRLHMGHLIVPNKVSWHDFCHTKNLKFTHPPAMSHEYNSTQ